MQRLRRIEILAVALACAACSDAASGSSFDGGAAANGGGSGGGSPGNGGQLVPGGGDAATPPGATGGGDGTLTATIRDFRLYSANDPSTNPDFENVPKTDGSGNPDPGYTGPWEDRGFVADALGSDGKPVFAKSGPTLSTHGAASFDQWYRDVAGTNLAVAYPIVLTPTSGGAFEYDSEKTGVPLSASDPTKMFFPIDDGTPYATAFGDQGDPHNYSFTVELHTRFTYRGGEYFHFRGDDDVFVFIAGKKVIDLGGIHAAEEASVTVDDLGLTKGQEYALDFFSAERHKTGSNILFTTTLQLRPAPPIK